MHGNKSLFGKRWSIQNHFLKYIINNNLKWCSYCQSLAELLHLQICGYFSLLMLIPLLVYFQLLVCFQKVLKYVQRRDKAGGMFTGSMLLPSQTLQRQVVPAGWPGQLCDTSCGLHAAGTWLSPSVSHRHGGPSPGSGGAAGAAGWCLTSSWETGALTVGNGFQIYSSWKSGWLTGSGRGFFFHCKVGFLMWR